MCVEELYVCVCVRACVCACVRVCVCASTIRVLASLITLVLVNH